MEARKSHGKVGREPQLFLGIPSTSLVRFLESTIAKTAAITPNHSHNHDHDLKRARNHHHHHDDNRSHKRKKIFVSILYADLLVDLNTGGSEGESGVIHPIGRAGSFRAVGKRSGVR